MNATAKTSTLLMNEMVLEPTPRPIELLAPKSRREEMVVGQLVAFNEDGKAIVTWPGLRDGTSQPASSIVPLGIRDVGRSVVLSFVTMANGPEPMIMGLIQQPTPLPATHTAPALGLEVLADGKRLVLSAQEEVTLRCGKSSITLTKAGKVFIDGEYVLSRSRGTNHVKGGSVQIN